MSEEMDPEVKARWVAALRSGEYKQGKFALCTRDGFQGQEGDTYCCLGVLNEIEKLGCHDDEPWLVRTNPDGSREVLDIVPSYARNILVAMNDGPAARSFNQIADWIEENL